MTVAYNQLEYEWLELLKGAVEIAETCEEFIYIPSHEYVFLPPMVVGKCLPTAKDIISLVDEENKNEIYI